MERDATYYYLMNSFLVARGAWAHLTAHPGATLQILGGLLVRAKLLLGRESKLSEVDELIRFSAEYARYLGLCLIFINFAFFLWASFALFRRGVSVAKIWLIQLFWVASPFAFSYVGQFQPEAVVLAISAAFTILLCRRGSRILGAALLIGSVLATKLNFLAYGAMIFLPRKWPAIVATAIFSLIVCFVLCLIFYPDLSTGLQHMLLLAMASGKYDQGPPGWPTIAAMSEQIRENEVGRTLIVFPLVLLTGLLGLVRRSIDPEDRRSLLVAILVFAGSAIVFLKKPTHDYYLMPSIGLIPCVVGAFFIATKGNWRAWFGGLTFFCIGLWLWGPLFLSESMRRASLHAADADFARLERILQEHSECLAVFSGPLPVAIDAMEMGAQTTGSEWREDLKRIFPHSFFLNPEFRFRQFSTADLSEAEWIKKESPSCVVFAIHPSFRLEAERRLQMAKEGRRLECGTYFCAYFFRPSETPKTTVSSR